MKTYTLNNGIKMPRFGLGTFLVGQNESAYDIVKTALKIGYRHIDTAQAYGNEKDIGRAIRDSGIPREEIFVTSKLKGHKDGDMKQVEAALEQSLKDLDIGYIDLMLIHWPNPDNDINVQIWQVFEKFYEKGDFKAIGLSNFLIHHIDHLLKYAKVHPAANQVECHPILTQIVLEKYLKTHDIQMISYGPFARGKVFDEPTKGKLEAIAKHYGASITQLIIAWGLKRGIAMIPKSVHEDRLIENFKGQDIILTDEDVEKINDLNRGLRLYSDPDNNINYK